MNHPPSTPEEWWSNIDAAWDGIIATFDVAISEIAQKGRGPFSYDAVALDRARAQRDHTTIQRSLQDLFWKAPDEAVIHTWPAWGVICDLLSEYEEIFDQED